MILYLPPSSPIIDATIQLPFSKSWLNRMQILWFLEGKPTPEGLAGERAGDVRRLQACLQMIHDTTDKTAGSCSSSEEVVLPCGSGGTVLRFLTALLAVTPGRWCLTGDKRLMQRPIHDLLDALKGMGAEITREENGIHIVGQQTLHNTAFLRCEKSSQFASALLLIAPALGELDLHLEGPLPSEPYVEMTLGLLRASGLEIERSPQQLSVRGKLQTPLTLAAERDWTAASYAYARAALSEQARIFLPGLSLSSLQGDAIVAQWMQAFGVESQPVAEGIVLLKKEPTAFPKKFIQDFRHHPDLAQTFAVVCAATKTEALLEGLSSLRNKESDRLLALTQELQALGVPCRRTDDSLHLLPASHLSFHRAVQTYNDHRMAMSFSLWTARGNSIAIADPQVVEKSFPKFWISQIV